MNNCHKCGACCQNPGMMLPNDIARISNSIGITAKELAEKYLLATLVDDGEGEIVLALLPAKKGFFGRRFPDRIMTFGYNTRRGRCIFYSTIKRECTINAAKPSVCIMLECKRMTGGNSMTLEHSKIRNAWRDNQTIIHYLMPWLKGAKTLDEISSTLKIRKDEISLQWPR